MVVIVNFFNKPCLSGRTREIIVAPQLVSLTEISPFLSSKTPTFCWVAEPLAIPEAARMRKQSSTPLILGIFLPKELFTADRWAHILDLYELLKKKKNEQGRVFSLYWHYWKVGTWKKQWIQIERRPICYFGHALYGGSGRFSTW